VMDARMRESLDDHITGHYGEDQFKGAEEPSFSIVDDGTLDTVLKCDNCGEELRYNIDLSDVEIETEDSNEHRIQRALDLAESEHECVLVEGSREQSEGMRQIMDALFPKEEERRRQGLCPFCAKQIDPGKEFRDELSRKEFAISGLCQKCQDKTFGG